MSGPVTSKMESLHTLVESHWAGVNFGHAEQSWYHLRTTGLGEISICSILSILCEALWAMGTLQLHYDNASANFLQLIKNFFIKQESWFIRADKKCIEAIVKEVYSQIELIIHVRKRPCICFMHIVRKGRTELCCNNGKLREREAEVDRKRSY